MPDESGKLSGEPMADILAKVKAGDWRDTDLAIADAKDHNAWLRDDYAGKRSQE